MDIEQLKELMKSEEFKSVAKDLNLVPVDEVNGLINKNKELLAEIRKIKDAKNDLESKVNSIDWDEIEELKTTKGGKTDELSKLQRELKKLTDALEVEKKGKSSLESELNKNKVEATLLKSFNDFNIDEKYTKILTDAISVKAKVEASDSGRTVLIDDMDAQDWFKSFVNGEGSAFIKTPTNKGASSSPVKGDGRKLSLDEIEKIADRTERLKALNEAGLA